MRLLLAISLMLFLSPSYSSAAIDCENAKSAVDLNDCAAAERDQAHQKMVRYFAASLEQFTGKQDLLREMKMAQRQWDSYMNTHCNSLYTLRSGQSGREQMALACETKLIEARTHQLWSGFLTYADSANPVLPDPTVE